MRGLNYHLVPHTALFAAPTHVCESDLAEFNETCCPDVEHALVGFVAMTFFECRLLGQHWAHKHQHCVLGLRSRTWVKLSDIGVSGFAHYDHVFRFACLHDRETRSRSPLLITLDKRRKNRVAMFLAGKP